MKETFFETLKKRRIWKTIVGYPAASFVILQAVDFFISKYGLNPKALNFSLIVLCGGFIIALIWNWLHGEEGYQNYTKKEAISYGLIGLLSLSFAFYFSNQSPSQVVRIAELSSEKSYRLAVLPFETISSDASMDNYDEAIRWYQIAIDKETTSFYQFTLDYIYPEEILQDPRFIQMKRDLNLPQ